MADADKDQKTEQPTTKRLSEARGQGQVPISQEVNTWFMIVAGAIVIGVFGDDVMAQMKLYLARFLAAPHDIELSALGVRSMFWGIAQTAFVVLLGPLTVIIAAAIVAGLVQTRFVFSLSRLKPSFKTFNIVQGVKGKLSLNSVTEFLKNLAKLGLVAPVIGMVLWPERHTLLALHTIPPDLIAPVAKWVVLKVLIAVIVMVAVIALADYVYQSYDFRKQRRMTKSEVKDETKQTEGDPKIKQKLRSIRMERARQRMMAAVAEADVVITNPSHFAVALQYVAETMNAPKVLAKGQDFIAQRIREIAEEHAVPIVENPPLARALYATAELDREIPVEHYKAVAEVIGYVMRLKGGLRSGLGRAR